MYWQKLCVRILYTLLSYYFILRTQSDHIKELNNARPSQPFFFLKPPSSILVPNEGPFLRPRGVKVHYEVELGLIIGKTVRDLEETDTQGALDAIGGM
jgi:acylpyruvate hydrolase